MTAPKRCGAGSGHGAVVAWPTVRFLPFMVLASAAVLAELVCPGTSLGAPKRAPVSAAHRPASQVVHRQRGRFGTILVVDEGNLRYLRFGSVDGDDESVISLSQPNSVPMEYVRLMSAALVYHAGPHTALMIGLGGGTFTSLLRRVDSALQVDAVEIDPVVVQIARRFFGVAQDDRYRIHVADGREFIERSTNKFDIIVLDAYNGAGIPAHLRGRDFFELVRSRLTRRGVVTANLTIESARKRRRLFAAFTSVFPHCRSLHAHESQNLVLIGSVGPMLGPKQRRRRAQTLEQSGKLGFDLDAVLSRLRASCGNY